MTPPRVLVTGATGKVGTALVDALCTRGLRVRALVRAHDARSRALAALGAEVFVGDFFDQGSLTSAMQGCDRAAYIPPFHPHALEAAGHFAEAARLAGPAHVVSLSQWLASPHHPAPMTRHHWMAEQLFNALPRSTHTVVAPGFFADNYLRLIGFAAQLGVLPSLTGDSTNAPPATEDIAAVLAAALADPVAHANQRYRPTGPALLSTRDMAAIIAAVLGHPVRRVEMPLWLFLKAARIQGVQAFELSGYRHYVRDHLQGAFAIGGPTDHVLRVTGRPPEDFATTARRYALRPEAQPRTATRVRAWLDFMRTPMMPGFNLDAIDRELGFPRVATSRYAMEDPSWRQARALTAP